MATIEALPRHWSAADIHRVVEAARAAPRWGVPAPWVLEFRGRSVLIYQTLEPDADRLLACGAALTNIRLAIRTEGWATAVRFPVDRQRPDLVAEVTAGDPLPPTPGEADQFAVVCGVRPTAARGGFRAVLSSVWCAGVELHPAASSDTWQELLVLTADDSHLDRVRAGAVAQSAVLAARAAGLAVRPPVNLLADHEARAALIERSMLAGYPQVRLRVGLGTHDVPAPRRPLASRPGRNAL